MSTIKIQNGTALQQTLKNMPSVKFEEDFTALIDCKEDGVFAVTPTDRGGTFSVTHRSSNVFVGQTTILNCGNLISAFRAGMSVNSSLLATYSLHAKKKE